MHLTINGRAYSDPQAAEVNERLEEAIGTNDLEIWLSHEDGPALCALLNGGCGWLMYLRHPEDAGFSSRNPARSEQDGEMETFVLSNGQADVYPRRWTSDRPTVFSALVQFVGSPDKPRNVDWHDDSAGRTGSS